MKNGTFKKGHLPWNLGLKGIHLNPKTEFKKGQFIGEQHPSWKGGVQVIKNDCVHIHTGANERIRRPKKVYEESNREIPKGWILYHLDRDAHNDELDNLIAIPRAILVRINSGRMNANYHEIKEAVEQFNNNKYG